MVELDTVYVLLGGNTSVGDGRRYALIDGADAPKVLPHRWHLAWRARGTRVVYAKARIGPIHVRMHRLILGCGPLDQVDHVNGDGLDNRRCNLRLATHSQNCANSRRPVGAAGYRGVGRIGLRWVARLGNQQLSRHDTAEDAARARDIAALARYGPFAWLNFPAA